MTVGTAIHLLITLLLTSYSWLKYTISSVELTAEWQFNTNQKSTAVKL